MLREKRKHDRGTDELGELVAAEERLRARREATHQRAAEIVKRARAEADRAERDAEHALQDELQRLSATVDQWRRAEEGKLAERARATEERLRDAPEDELARLVVEWALRGEVPP
ncbi:MAG: hypothetical protein HYV09_29010 [Deltaproteobacteria bacterium]|nr:hypothetical protein [Deltaproteobacteria bacterium]